MKRTILTTIVLMGTLAMASAAFGQETGVLLAPEQQAMSDTVQYALENNPSNQSSDWVNPDTGNSGGVLPVRTFGNAQGQPCREFISTIIIGGQEQQGYGTACRQPDGTWQIVSNEPATPQPPPAAEQTNIYVDNPPPAYYYFPSDFYYPYHIYLSFAYVYREGYIYRGTHFQEGRAFRHRYPIQVHRRVFITPHDGDRYHRMRGYWEYRGPKRVYREYKGREERRERQEWRDRDWGDERWHGGGH
jgi:surface antigen